jgi:hypothetical protein
MTITKQISIALGAILFIGIAWFVLRSQNTELPDMTRTTFENEGEDLPKDLPTRTIVRHGELLHDATRVIPERGDFPAHHADFIPRGTHRLITNQPRWQEIWREINPGRPLPEVDFDEYTILIVSARIDEAPPRPWVYARHNATHIVLPERPRIGQHTPVGAHFYRIPLTHGPIHSVDYQPVIPQEEQQKDPLTL